MLSVAEIQQAVLALSEDDTPSCASGSVELDWARWNGQIVAGSEMGRLDFLIDEAGQADEPGLLDALSDH